MKTIVFTIMFLLISMFVKSQKLEFTSVSSAYFNEDLMEDKLVVPDGEKKKYTFARDNNIVKEIISLPNGDDFVLGQSQVLKINTSKLEMSNALIMDGSEFYTMGSYPALFTEGAIYFTGREKGPKGKKIYLARIDIQ